MHREAVIDLLNRYREGKATETEKQLLADWVLFGKLKELDLNDEQLEKDLAMLDRRLSDSLQQTPAVRPWRKVAAAAAVLLMLSSAYYLYFHRQPTSLEIKPSQVEIQPVIEPGKDRAYLTLADGRKIMLSSETTEEIAEQAGVTISKTADGQLIYQTGQPASSTEAPSDGRTAYNTIETPNSGQYQIVLPDGSHVWLNAATSLTYPIRFDGNERVVHLHGEAYFEVTHLMSKPFKVISGRQQIQVLGTRFNINAYETEPLVKTTLVQGSVRLIYGSSSVVLKPGEQSQLNKLNDLRVVKDYDVEEAIAWKNGFFLFDNADIRSVMNQIARWYDVEVEYEDNLPNRRFAGKIPRNSDLDQALKILSYSKVNFKVENKKIKVTR